MSTRLRNLFRAYACCGTLRFYVLAVTCVTLVLILLHCIAIDYENFGMPKAYIVRSVVDGCVLMLPILFLPVRYKKWWWGSIAVFTVWVLCQIWYSRTYHDFMSASSFFMTENVNTLLIKSTLYSMRAVDGTVVAVPLLCYVYYRIFLRSLVLQERWRWPLSMGVPAVVLLVMLPLFLYVECKKEQQQRVITSFAGRFTEPTSSNKMFFMEHNGLLPSIAMAIWSSSEDDAPLTQEELKNIKTFIQSNSQNVMSHFVVKCRQNRDKNLILIIVESLNSWVVDLKINGREVCPNLNACCRDSNAVVGLKMVPQVHAGRSSDGHLMYNTGLLPVATGATTMLRGDANYPSLAKAMPQYVHVNFSCEDGKLWNQKVTNASYGYEKYYNMFSLQKIVGKEEVIDQELFEGAARVIDSIKQPFMAQILTIAMHQPFTLVKRKTWISKSCKYNERVLNYLECVNYFDEAFGKFLKQLKRMGKYDNSVVVIVSDHNELDKNELDKRPTSVMSDKYCTFVVMNAGVAHRQKQPMGQIDVYPTILDLMGLNDYWWKGLGQSILLSPAVETAVTIDGEVVGNVHAPQVNRQKQAWSLSNTMIMKRYFDRNHQNSHAKQ